MRIPDKARSLNQAGGNDAWVAGVRALATGFRLLVWTALLAGLPATAAIGRDPDPAIRIPLERMGYQTLLPEFLRAGSSMLTVDFVDRDHLLVTFGVRRLMRRDAAQPMDEDDRTIGAFVVELPSGKVLARTEWRVHDRGRYLWSLGQGRFLLRVRNRLTTFSPRDFSDPAEAFRESPLLQLDRHVLGVLVSADSDLLTVESTRWAMGAGASSEGFSVDPAPVQISFYRLSDSAGEGLRAFSAGTIRTSAAVELPLTTAGRLEVLRGGKDHWLFNFEEHAGKVEELSPFDTSCYPRATFVGHSEFVAFGCRGSRDKIDLAGFNLKGVQTWQQNFYDFYVDPTFAFAPEAGRFALGRTIVSGDFDPDAPLPASMVSAQEVRVYQSYDGKQLFRIQCTPVELAGQNFALSPDGLRLAVVREMMVHHSASKEVAAYTQSEAAVEIYTLPALTPDDIAAVKAATTMAPADTGARIDLALARGLSTSSKNASAGKTKSGAEDVPANDASMRPAEATQVQAQGLQGASTTETGANQQAGATDGTAASGDPQPIDSPAGQASAPRKPPTLYGPDETPKKPK